MTEPYWRLDAINEDTLTRVHHALRPFVAEDSLTAAVDEVVRAYRGGPRVEDYVPDAAVFTRRQTVKAHMGQLLASALRGDGGSRADMGWLVHALAVAAEKVYEPVIAASDIALEPDDETRCHRCGGQNVLSWCAPSPLWNAVMRGGSINNEDEFNGFVCPSCFAQLAQERGIAKRWRLHAEQVLVALETVTPSGRVWDEQTWMWVEPAPTSPRPILHGPNSDEEVPNAG